MAEQDKDPRVQEKPDDQKGGPEGTRDARSAFRPLRDKIPPPGMSCCRNSISSSYSSTGGFPWLKRGKGPASSHCQLPLTSSKTVTEVSPQAVSQGQAQCEKAADSAPGEKLAPRSGSLTSQASRPGRRKFPLLPRRRGAPLRLPSPLQLGFWVTAEDLDLEKQAEIMCINCALQGEDKSIWECRASVLSHALSSAAKGTSSLPAVPKAPSMDAQQERRKSQDSLDPMVLQASAAGSPSRPPVSGRKLRSAGPLFSSDTLPATSAHSRDSAQASSSAPTQPAQDTTAHSATGVSLPSTFTWSLAGTLSNPSSASHTTTLARQRVRGFTLLQKLDTIAAAITESKPVVLHGQQQRTRTLKRVHPYSCPAASAAAQASSSASTQPAQSTAAHSAAGVSLPTTSTSSLAGTLSNPSSASLITTMARLTISGPTSLLKLPVTAAATTQPKPVVLHGQQQGTRGLKRACSSSDPAASALSPPTKRKSIWAAGPAGTLSNPSSASLITALAKLRVRCRTSLRKLALMAAAITQSKPVVLHGQQQGTHTLKWVHPYSRPAASAAAQASSSAPTQPAQGTTAHSAAGVSLPTTSTLSQAGTLSNPSSSSPRDAHAASSDCRRLR
ncbi:hypothetical protein P7K49_029274 [Saguinus oedipus]|uniref:Uncharacterized protein n=1 Tax=Saguinus oedipus TaxID=9490 RepID=A0ABQ9U7I7_SAGOE|nr:hypothetical protein P7K49_029274 [Saguinus oedipus]